MVVIVWDIDESARLLDVRKKNVDQKAGVRWTIVALVNGTLSASFRFLNNSHRRSIVKVENLAPLVSSWKFRSNDNVLLAECTVRETSMRAEEELSLNRMN